MRLKQHCFYKVKEDMVIDESVPYPAIFLGCRFFDERSEEKNRCAARESGAAL